MCGSLHYIKLHSLYQGSATNSVWHNSGSSTPRESTKTQDASKTKTKDKEAKFNLAFVVKIAGSSC